MAIDTETFERWKATKFEGRTHQELRDAGTMLGCTFGANTSNDTMRKILCEKLGELPNPPEPAPPPAVKAAPVAMTRMQRPRLAPGDIWEGRRRRVKVAKAAENAHHKAFVLYWNFVPKSFPYDVQIDMPFPYYEILRTCNITTVRQEPVFDNKGAWVAQNNIDEKTPRYSYVDMGWTPGTEDLPDSIKDFWQREAKAKNYFRDLLTRSNGRNTLIQIRADLYGSVGPGFYKDLTNEDIWQDVIRFLGFEDIFYEEATV